MCARFHYFASVSIIFLSDFRTVLAVWYFTFHFISSYLICIVLQISTLYMFSKYIKDKVWNSVITFFLLLINVRYCNSSHSLSVYYNKRQHKHISLSRLQHQYYIISLNIHLHFY